MPQNKILVRIDRLTHVFKNRTVLKDIDVAIPKGKFVALSGPDGAGKTTLIRLMAALLLPTKGTIVFDGFDTVQAPEEIHQRLGYMPQRFGLYEDLTVLQNLILYADLQNVVGQKRKDAFDKLLTIMQLSAFTHRLAGALSGGMKQKLGLACTLLHNPILLLLDEPTVGVDPISRRELWNMMQTFLSEKITIVWSTAYLEEAEKSDLAILLNEGKIIYQGPPKELTKKVEGRVFTLPNVLNNKRALLSKLLDQKEIEDGTIQGNSLRILTKTPYHSNQWIPREPRFEDAFIDILGGGPGGHSLLAANLPLIAKQSSLVIDAKELTKKFGTFTAVDQISFQVFSGEVFGLLGPNGAGKSTTFKMLCGLMQPTSGKAFVNAVSLQHAPAKARSHIGYMAQKFSLYGDLSVKHNLDFFSGVYNLTGQKRRDAVDQMIAIFNFEPLLHQTANLLPIGYRQRLALACSVMHHPEVLFLDEPTSGVDPITRREFWNHINGLAELGCTVMVTTHFLDEAEYCDRIGLVYHSKLIYIGTPDELKVAENAATLEDAFITLIEQYDGKKAKSTRS